DERGLEFFERGNETLLELFRGADVNSGRDDIVARLPHVDVIIRVNRRARADRLTGQLAAAIGNDFVRIRVRTRARPGLENIERVICGALASDHFLCRY